MIRTAANSYRIHLIFICFAGFQAGCSKNHSLQQKELLANQAWLDVTVDESVAGPNRVTVTTAPPTDATLSYQEFVSVSGNPIPERTLTNFQELDFYRRLSFYAGTIGGIYSIIANNQGNIRGRTIGNGLWGIGWTCWLGFGALIRADSRLLLEQHNDTLQQAGSDFAGRVDDPAWTVLWRIREF